MKQKALRGIVILLIGIVCLILSQTVKFTKQVATTDPFRGVTDTTEYMDPDKKNGVLALGLILFLSGGVMTAREYLGKKQSNDSPSNG